MKILFVALLIVSSIYSRPEYLNKIPNGNVGGDCIIKRGTKTSCQICHEYADPSSSSTNRNPFGRDFAQDGHSWNSTLGNRDSDGDGFTNVTELKCSNYSWNSGICGDGYNSTNPGDPEVSPSTTTEIIAIPAKKSFLSALPNPFNPSTVISFKLPDNPSFVKVTIFDSKGIIIRSITTSFKNGGIAYWDGNDNSGKPVSAGVYTALAANASSKLSIKLILAR
jgi:hypothetical protein